MILTVQLVLVPSSPGLRLGLCGAETPFAAIRILLGEPCLCVFCQKPAFYWQIEGFWRSQAEVAGSNVQHLDANVQSAGLKVEPANADFESVNPKVQPVNAGVEPVKPNVEVVERDFQLVKPEVELGNANLQFADSNIRPANLKI
jgi:hypothetical protein